MDDLAGMDWSNTTSSNNPAKKPPMNPSSAFGAFPSLQPTPSPLASGRNTPLSNTASGNAGNASFKAPAAAAAVNKPAQDAFSNLMSMSGAKTKTNLSLAERQKQLEAEKAKKLQEKKKQQQAAYGDGQFWDTLGQGGSSGGVSRTASPLAHGGPGLSSQIGSTSSDNDLFAAFDKDTKVDNASFYPPPSQPTSRNVTPALDLSNPSAWSKPAPSNGANGGFNDDDDPFGLNEFQAKAKPIAPSAPAPVSDDEEGDDLLGDLGRPVDEVRKKREAQQHKAPRQEPEPGKPIEDLDSSSSDDERDTVPRGRNDPFDQAVAQIVEMGFSPEDATRGLTESGQGLNVQGAISFLLNDAHRKAKEKSQGLASPAADEERSSSRNRRPSPGWVDEEMPRRQDARSPATGEVDLAKQAAAMGTSFLKTANKFWSAGQKKVQKAVAELQDGPVDPSQPKWMRSAQADTTGEREARRMAEFSDEAMMLESGGRPGRPSKQAQPSRPDPRRAVSRDQSPAISGTTSSSSVPRWQQDPKSRLNKQAIEDQSSQAYVSPARRKKTTPQPPAEPKPFTEEPDLLFSSKAPAQSLPTRSAQPSPRPAAAPSQNPRNTPTPRPAAPPRNIPHLDPAALQTSTRHRIAGTDHFKRGDYSSAHASYSSSLAAVPDTHPLAIVILCNRALTALKTGEPRQAVNDADAAIALIGPSKGEGEHVPLQDQTGEKRDMKDLYGKALTRKAEALEQLEKWADAGLVWQACVESGVGGPTAIAGRQRCQKALAPKPAAKPVSKPASARSTPRATPRPTAALSQKDSEAVTRLQAANVAAEAVDAEKFALADQVDARIAAWRDGKRENLRALLASLDTVLWEGSGWKKVGLHELVMANKVKINYMKAIAKTHPDKLPQDASTEVRMIAGTVFSTLNESWDKFKTENGL
ncbi:auxilin-like clathrin-binding protein required for normal clathrin function [Gnomoniopsis smithogilvyi]|uniref:Auxilin-like clathrin-binding protein required for normal clathrin function n=1 Tax=Gnomoniopsis smithogilvyi TaxID=1191159 RepID=A0A9W8YMW2_9PEZI|nr:auxilin-like clathrin-binding protein required for normal clathrin function [Gnomoniopsis smithogilvyi]